MDEEVKPDHLADEHSSLQIIERVAWAVNDADLGDSGEHGRHDLARAQAQKTRPRRRMRVLGRQRLAPRDSAASLRRPVYRSIGKIELSSPGGRPRSSHPLSSRLALPRRSRAASAALTVGRRAARSSDRTS
jgi:hypothetical protein